MGYADRAHSGRQRCLRIESALAEPGNTGIDCLVRDLGPVHRHGDVSPVKSKPSAIDPDR